MFSNFRQCYQVMKDHSNITNIHFWMIQKAKNEVFGHFLEFGLLDRLDIAYCDSTKCLPTFGNVTRSSWIIQKSEKCIFEWSKVPKMRFLAIFLSLVCWFDLILHILMVLNNLVMIWLMLDHSKSRKMHFWLIQRAKNGVFGHFLNWGPLDWLDIA